MAGIRRAPVSRNRPAVEKGVRVLYVQYTNPAGYPPIEHSAQLLADSGAEVLLLGTRRVSDRLTFATHPRIKVLHWAFAPAGWRQKLHYFSFLLWVLVWTARWRPKWIYASDVLACPIALASAILFARSVIYHEHDSPGAAVPSGLFARLTLRARSALAARAAICILPNEVRAEAFRRQTTRADVMTVWNCPLLREVTAPRPARTGHPGRVLYHGSLVPGRLPLVVIDAIASIPLPVVLVVAGYETAGHPGYANALLTRAAELGISDRVQFVGTLARRDELMEQCRQCDIGLSFMPIVSEDFNEQAMVGASNKAFDYMASGLALMVANLPDWDRCFVQTGCALSCDPRVAAEIAACLRQLLDAPERCAAMGERGRRQVLERWNYEAVFRPVQERILAGERRALAEVRS